MIHVQLRVQTRTHLQHTSQTAQQRLQERIDGHDLHVVKIEQHMLETMRCTFLQHFVRHALVTNHELTGIIEKILLPAFRNPMQIVNDTFAHLCGRLVGKRDGEYRTIVLAGQ